MTDRSADILRKTRLYDRQNLSLAKEVLRNRGPEYLLLWAQLVVERIEGKSETGWQELLFEAAA